MVAPNSTTIVALRSRTEKGRVHVIKTHNGPLLTQAVVPYCCAVRGITVETQPAATTVSHDGQDSSSRKHQNSYHHPFPVQEATAHVAYSLQPAIFTPE